MMLFVTDTTFGDGLSTEESNIGLLEGRDVPNEAAETPTPIDLMAIGDVLSNRKDM